MTPNEELQLKEIKRLKAIIERDRSLVADGLKKISVALNMYEWLIYGRGSYEWDDDKWREEFRDAVELIDKQLDSLKEIVWDHSDCPITREEISTARRMKRK